MSKKNINTYVDSFLHNLKTLIKEIYNLTQDDPVMYRATKRINLLINIDPATVIDKVGKKLYEYKEFIYDESTEDSLLNLTFEKEINKVETIENANLANLLIFQLKQMFLTLEKNQKIIFRKMVCELLDDFINYEYEKRT